MGKRIPSRALYDGTGTHTTSASALNSGTSQPCGDEVAVQADPDNTADVFVGNSSSQSWQLAPGDAIGIPVGDVALVYAKSATGTQRVNWLAGS